MLNLTRFPLFLAVLGLSACSALQGDPLRYPVPDLQPAQKVRVGAYGSVELREVSLPEYATLAEMAVETPEGGITTQKTQLWADNPVRAVTLELTRHLSQITGLTVASQPWPFESNPDARVDVRIEQMLADRQNMFRLSGQIFVSPTEEGGRPRARFFSLSVPIAAPGDAQAMAAARGQIVQDLAVFIARNGLR